MSENRAGSAVEGGHLISDVKLGCKPNLAKAKTGDKTKILLGPLFTSYWAMKWEGRLLSAHFQNCAETQTEGTVHAGVFKYLR